MKLNELLNENEKLIRSYFKEMKNEFTKDNSDNEKIKRLYKCIENNFLQNIKDIEESYKTLHSFGLMSDNTFKKNNNEIQEFYKNTRIPREEAKKINSWV